MTLLSATRQQEDAGAPAPSGPEGLLVEKLAVAFGSGRAQAQAVRGVSFAVKPRSTLVLVGESGSGKSVTARAVLGLLGPRASVSGRALLDGADLLGAGSRSLQARRGSDIAFVPQDASAALDPLRRAGSQLAEVLRAHRVERGRRAAWRHGEECLAAVGIADPRRVARAYPHELSGGMRQRVLIAIATACQPRVLIADEPTTALDVSVQAQVLELFALLQERTGMGLLMVTHDVGVARQIADRVAVMYAGRIVEEGPVSLLENPAHYYTAGLLGAVPRPGMARGTLTAIPGRPPTILEIPACACGFIARCYHATPACHDAIPPLVEVGPAHKSACPPMASALGIRRSEGAEGL